MTERMVQKIEEIRSMPEHVRLQYAFGAVFICMIFVVGIWLLTLREGFLGVSSEMKEGSDEVESSISTVKSALPTTDSLRTLKEQSESLMLEKNDNNADQFLEGELQKSAPTNSNLPN